MHTTTQVVENTAEFLYKIKPVLWKEKSEFHMNKSFRSQMQNKEVGYQNPGTELTNIKPAHGNGSEYITSAHLLMLFLMKFTAVFLQRLL